MTKKKRLKIERPESPDTLEGEALLEWGRICDDLDAAGQLARADRAVITVYVQTWAVWVAAARVVAVDGPVVLLPNGWPGESSESKVMGRTGAQLEKLLDKLGLNPQARHKMNAAKGGEDEADLDF